MLNKTLEKILVIGAGAWGTALADLLAKNNSDVCLIAKNQKIADEINLYKTNSNFLPNIVLSPNLKTATNLALEASEADLIFIVTPSSATEKLLEEITHIKLKSNVGFVLCNKGLHDEKLQLFHQIIEENYPEKNYAILSGPNFAAEVAANVPTITTISSKNQDFSQKIIALLQNKNFIAHHSSDIVAAEICGIVKNIMAIACGIVDGLNLGQNTKAALVVQGIAEIKTLCQKFGSNGEINSAAGFGDIFLTCASTKSRNNSLGLLIAQGQKAANFLQDKKTYEGAVSAKTLARLATKLDLQLPLCKTVNYILQNDLQKDEIKSLIISAILKKY